MKMPRLTVVQPEPVSPCIAIVKAGLAVARISRKQVSNTEIQHQILSHRITSDRPQQER